MVRNDREFTEFRRVDQLSLRRRAEPTRLAQKEKWRSRGWNKLLNVSMIASRYADGLCSNTCIYGTFEPVLC